MLTVGTRIRDNDPDLRAPRILTIASVDGDNVVATNTSTGKSTKIAAKRIFSDGKARRSGYSTLR
jgi:hypothetical protein